MTKNKRIIINCIILLITIWGGSWFGLACPIKWVALAGSISATAVGTLALFNMIDVVS